jgi:hypothetical protein
MRREKYSMDTAQDIKTFLAQNELDKDESLYTESSFDRIPFDEWQDRCMGLAIGIREWTVRLELRLASIERRLATLEDRNGHRKDSICR